VACSTKPNVEPLLTAKYGDRPDNPRPFWDAKISPQLFTFHYTPIKSPDVNPI
jgi:hypothetical protein